MEPAEEVCQYRCGDCGLGAEECECPLEGYVLMSPHTYRALAKLFRDPKETP